MSTGAGGNTPAWMTSPASKYGGAFLSESNRAAPEASALVGSGGPGASDARHVLSPHDPLVWVLGVAAVAVGFMYASTTVRVGPVTAGASVGKP
jgi:hypothetical protein